MVVPIILYIDQRTDWRMLLILPLAVQAEIDQTWLARCQIRGLSSQLIAEPSATVLLNKSVSLALNRTQTDTKPGKYAFDLLLQSPLGDRRKTVQGTAIIASTVTIWQVPPVTPPVVPPDATPPWLTDVVNSAIATHNANLAAHPGLSAGGGSVQTRTVFTPTNGQTVFTLAAVPALPHLSYLFLNGVKAMFGPDYTINGANVNWQNRVQLGASDEFEVFYQ